MFISVWSQLFSETWSVVYNRGTPINMADSCHLGVGIFVPVATTPLIFLVIKLFFEVWMRLFYAWNKTKVYMITFYDHYLICGPTIKSFHTIFLLFVYILKFVSFLLENEYGRFRLLRHTVVSNSHKNYWNTVYFRSYQRISVYIGINAKCR